MNLTAAEKALLVEFAYCDYNCTNGAPEYATCAEDLATYVFLEDRRVEGMNTQQLKGVLGSLVKKELVETFKDCDGEYLNFTDLGYETVKGML